MANLWKAYLLRLRTRQADEQGFSLVELIISLAVMAVLVSIAAPVYGNVKDGARRSAVKAAAKNGLDSATVALEDGNPATTTETAFNALTNEKMDVYFYQGYKNNVYTDSPTDEEYGVEKFCVRADIRINGSPDFSYGMNTGPGCVAMGVDPRYIF